MLALVIVLMPIVLTVGAFTATMTSRTDRLSQEIYNERALLAAESGVDYAIWLGKTGVIGNGYEESYDLGRDSRFYVRATHLLYDGADNDGDGPVDEADENVFQIISTGRYRDTTRRIAAYLGPVPLVPDSYAGAINLMTPMPQIQLSGTSRISGEDTNIDDSRGAPVDDVAAFSIAPPGTVADLQAQLSGGELTRIAGIGSPPLAVGSSLDLATIVAAVQNSANVVLTNGVYGNFDFGSGAAGTPVIAYRDGDVRFAGTATGAGILVVTGDLTMAGTFRFDGVVIVLGDIVASGTARICGSIVQGVGAPRVTATGTLDVTYSQEAITLANSIGGRYVSFNGWQELAR